MNTITPSASGSPPQLVDAPPKSPRASSPPTVEEPRITELVPPLPPEPRQNSSSAVEQGPIVSPITRCPKEIIDGIVPYINPKDVFNLRLTNRQIRDSIHEFRAIPNHMRVLELITCLLYTSPSPRD